MAVIFSLISSSCVSHGNSTTCTRDLVSPKYHNYGFTVVAWKAAKTEKITFSVFALQATTKAIIVVVFWGLGDTGGQLGPLSIWRRSGDQISTQNVKNFRHFSLSVFESVSTGPMPEDSADED